MVDADAEAVEQIVEFMDADAAVEVEAVEQTMEAGG